MAASSNSPTILSSALIVAEVLRSNERVAAITRKVYPVSTDEAVLPYICYARSGVSATPTKSVPVAAMTATVEVACFTEGYSQGVELAEAVCSALHLRTAVSADGRIKMRSCVLVEAVEDWQSDAYVQQLTFEIKA